MPQEEESGGYYYWAVTNLMEMIPVEERAPEPELDEIDQIRKVVEEISCEPPQFFTTT